MNIRFTFFPILTADIHGSLGHFFRIMLANEQILDISFRGMGITPIDGNNEASYASSCQASSSGVGDDGTF